MERAETEVAIAIMQAWVDGKIIQFRTRGQGNEWKDVVDNDPSWCWDKCRYRVKPQVRYRPYSSPEECFNDLRCDGWLKRREGTTYYTRICSLDMYVDYQRMFMEYTYVDGTPFGLKVSQK